MFATQRESATVPRPIRSNPGAVDRRQFSCTDSSHAGLYGRDSLRTVRDEQRLVGLYRRFGPVIFARCRGILGDNAAAEDATQETFMRVQRHLDSSPPQALTWIYRIATNYCFNELRNRRRRAVPVDVIPEVAVAGVEEALADRDLAARLIRRAHPKIAAAAWLHYVEGMDQEEVAAVLDISRRTVINRLAEFNKNAMKFVRRAHG